MARSKIWKYYDKIDHNTAQCKLCERIIKTSGNTSNLMKHMKTHPQVNVNDNESTIIRGIYKRDLIADGGPKKRSKQRIKSERGMHIKTEELNIIQLEDGEEEVSIGEAHVAVENVVQTEVKFDACWTAAEAETESGATVSAEDIIEFEPGMVDEQMEGEPAMYQLQELPLAETDELDNNNDVSAQRLLTYHDNLAFFVCRDKQPLHIVEGVGFKLLTHALCPIYRLPSAEQLGARIAQLTQQQVILLRNQFASLHSLSLSCAVSAMAPIRGSMESSATQQRPTCLELVAHYYEDQTWRARTLIVQPLPANYNAGTIVEWLERACHSFDIDKSKIACVVTRNNRMLENAVAGLLGAQRHLPCFADMLDSVLDSALKRSEFGALCDKVRHNVEQYLAGGVLPPIQTQLQLDVKHRPISTYDMIDRFVKFAPATLTNDDLELCQQLLAVLKPLASGMRELCRPTETSYPCASKSLPIAYIIINELKKSRSSELKLTHDLRSFLVRQLEERFELMEKNVHMAMASLLDPRFRNMPFQSSTLVAKYMTKLYDLLQQHVESGQAAADATITAEDDDFWAAYKSFSYDKHKHIGLGSDTDSDEISMYFCNNISTLQAEPLVLWKDLAQFHPFLHSLAKKYLHIPATAIPPARIFSAVGSEVAAQRSRLFGEHMNNMLFMADCTQNEWQI